MFKTQLLALCVAFSFLLSFAASAKDLPNRLGVGIKQDSAMDNLPEITAVYFPDADLAVTSALGIDTKKDYSRFVFNGGVRRVVFKEDNMNFFMGGLLGLVNYENAGDKKSGFELNALFGGEFFLPGLDSLGFSFEGGAGVVSTSDVRFRTLADLSVVFYF
jgi:hypothetical protein